MEAERAQTLLEIKLSWFLGAYSAYVHTQSLILQGLKIQTREKITPTIYQSS